VGAGGNDRFRLTPVVAGLLAITIVSAVAAAAVMCALRVRSQRHRNQRRQDLCGAGTGSVMGGGIGGGAAVIAVCKQKADDDDEDYAAATSDPDKNPDLIPPTKIKSAFNGRIVFILSITVVTHLLICVGNRPSYINYRLVRFPSRIY